MGGAHRRTGSRPSRRAVRRRPRSRRSLPRHGWRPAHRLLQAAHRRRRARRPARGRRRGTGSPSGATRCSAASGSTSPRIGRCSTSPCGPTATRCSARSGRTARSTTSCRRSTTCSARWASSPSECATDCGSAQPVGGSARSSTSASAGRISARRWPYRALRAFAQPGLTCRFVSNVDGAAISRCPRRPRSGRDAVRRLLEDVHDDRDADERPHGASVARRGTG